MPAPGRGRIIPDITLCSFCYDMTRERAASAFRCPLERVKMVC